MRTKSIAFFNNKGGVGKTTFAWQHGPLSGNQGWAADHPR